ncbi:hypothetical protein BYT27DRAFT_7180605 [Phlegmacium glaucopus]|nr:hypothetical protein BYT27DRAFT_7180605 [Phlegmacium glaucopus]
MLALLWRRDSSVGNEPLYSPYIASASIAAGAQAVNRSSAAALAFLIWDILITTDEEVKLMWPRSWSYTKVVYFFIRYVPMLVQVSILLIGTELTPPLHFTPHDCYIWQIYQAIAASLILMAIDTILILRVHALYHGNSTMPKVVAAFFLVEIVGMVVGLSLALPGITYDNLCLVINVPRTLIIYATSAILFQAFLFVITLFKFVLAIRSGWGDVPLLILLTRDGTWAFFLLFFAYGGHLVLYALHNPAYAGVLYGWLLTIFSFCGYRILLNLNHLANDVNGLDTTNGHTGTNIQFSTQFSHQPTYETHELASQGYTSSGGRTLQSSYISALSLEH